MPVRIKGIRACAIGAVVAVVVCGLPQSADAQTAVAIPDMNQTTTLTATVSEQARVTVPAGISFSVDNVNTSTSQGNVAISVQNIALTTATKQLRISLTANAASFTPPEAGATTWVAGDVSWNSGPGGGPNAWQNATGSAGTLSSAAYNTVATCNADTTSCSILKLSFTLAAKPAVKRSGAHTLTVTWKFESIGS
jgi:hypothetical protein